MQIQGSIRIFLENQLQKFDVILGIRVLEIKQNFLDKFVEGVQGMNLHIYSRPSLFDHSNLFRRLTALNGICFCNGIKCNKMGEQRAVHGL